MADTTNTVIVHEGRPVRRDTCWLHGTALSGPARTCPDCPRPPVHGDRRLDRTTFSDGSHVDSFVYWSDGLAAWVTGSTFDLLAEDGE